MDSDDQSPLLQELAALRKEVKSVRRWIIFASLCLAILVTPQTLDFIDKSGARGGGAAITQIVAVIVFFFVMAAVISHFSSKSS